MRISRATQRDLEYPEAFFQNHEIRTLPDSRYVLLFGLFLSFAAAAITGFPVFWLVRLLRRRAGLWGRRFLVLLYGAPVLCALVPAAWSLFSSMIRAARGPAAREVDKWAEEVHERARAVVLSAEASSGRFSLFVRAFDHERDSPTLFPWPMYANRWTLEQRLAKVLEGHMPIVTLASTGADAGTSFVKSGILRLFVDVDQWQVVFRRLAAAAALIIILDEPGGPGLLYELSVIDELQRNADAVVLTDEDFHVLSFGFGDGKEFALDDYEDKVAVIRRFREEEEEEEDDDDDDDAIPEIEPVVDPRASSLVAKIAGDAESGLLRLRDLFSSGRF